MQKRLLEQEVRLSKIRRLLHRRGIEVPYSTLHRFAVAELDFGRHAPTIPVADGNPGEEIQIDTGWMTMLEPDERGRRLRFGAWIFTPHLSRYRLVYPCFAESTETAMGILRWRVRCRRARKAIVHTADPLKPRIIDELFEYAQARGFHIDPTRVRHPKDKARTERAVRDVRDECFPGEKLLDLDGARGRGRHWYAEEYGMRRHTTTQRMPREHFDAVEKTALNPAPLYDVPLWAEPKSRPISRSRARCTRCRASGSVRARADRSTVYFYDPATRELVKTHARKPPGGRSPSTTESWPSRTKMHFGVGFVSARRWANSGGSGLPRA